EEEGENWVWHGATILREDDANGGREYRYALISLSRGGSDADVTREFDLSTITWVKEGFYRPESKGGMSWIDRDTVFVYTDTGAGSLTSSGYPRQVRRWHRGTALEDAPIVYEGESDDMYILAAHDSTPGYERDFVIRSRAFYDSEIFLLEGEELTKIDVPRSAEAGIHRDWLVVELREDWHVPAGSGEPPVTYPAGGLIAIRWEDFRARGRNFQTLFALTAATSIAAAAWTMNHLILTGFHDVNTRLFLFTSSGAGLQRTAVPGLPDVGTGAAGAVESKFTDDVWVTTTDPLSPTSLS